jgi:hypothetical protein
MDGLACPYTILFSVTIRQGDRASCQVLTCPIALQWAVVPFWGVGGARPLCLDI